MLLRCTQRWTRVRILHNFRTKYFFSFKIWFVWKRTLIIVKALTTLMAPFTIHRANIVTIKWVWRKCQAFYFSVLKREQIRPYVLPLETLTSRVKKYKTLEVKISLSGAFHKVDFMKRAFEAHSKEYSFRNFNISFVWYCCSQIFMKFKL